MEQDNLAKKLHFEEEKMSAKESEGEHNTAPVTEDNKPEPTKLEKHEPSILKKIEKMLSPIKTRLQEIRTEWREHKKEMKQMKVDKYKLEHDLIKERKKNKELGRRVRWLEDKLLENNVILRGISKATWETEEMCREKISTVLANLVNRATWQEKLEVAKLIPIKSVRRLGIYNSMRWRPIVVRFGSHSNVEYLLENKKRLGRGIFADQEYGPETEKNLKLLQPIFNAARKHENFKGKSKMEGDKLILQGKEYSVDTIGSIHPEMVS